MCGGGADMIIIPAIDIKNGRCVRLRQGRAENSSIYSEYPVEMAERWAAEGAQYLHVVDLDGAFQGRPVHTKIIAEIVRTVAVPIQVGGGLRTDEDIKRLLDCGVDHAIIGTRAFTEADTLKRLVQEFSSRLAVGIDARGGKVQVKGWVETTGMKAVDLASMVSAAGVKTVIYTDTARDGMLGGTNIKAVEEICSNVTCDVIASGGISSLENIETLRDLRQPNLVGAIVGKALYEGKVSLKELSGASAQADPPGRKVNGHTGPGQLCV